MSSELNSSLSDPRSIVSYWSYSGMHPEAHSGCAQTSHPKDWWFGRYLFFVKIDNWNLVKYNFLYWLLLSIKESNTALLTLSLCEYLISTCITAVRRAERLVLWLVSWLKNPKVDTLHSIKVINYWSVCKYWKISFRNTSKCTFARFLCASRCHVNCTSIRNELHCSGHSNNSKPG